MISVEEALQRILDAISPLAPTQVPLSDALGLTLAQDIVAHEDMPPFANSAMDGFALRSIDSQGANVQQPSRLQIIGTIPAGSVATDEVISGTAMRIMTGAPVPAGADSVVQVELTSVATADPEWVEVFQEVSSGNNIRPAGEDIQCGQVVLRKGDELRAWDIGILATLGWSMVPVIRRTRVAILGTGDEIIDVDQALQPGKIRNSNSYLLEAAIRNTGAEPYRLGIARDTRESLQQKLQEAMHYDLIITSGGVSVGDFDLVKEMMNTHGSVNFWRINMRPGKPVAFGRIGETPLLGLPGNPVSTAVTFELFGRPLLRKMQGQQHLFKPQIPVILGEDITERARRRHYIRARVQWQNDQWIAYTTGNQGSHIMTSLRGANALLVIPENQMRQRGDTVQAIMLDWPEQGL